MIDRDELRKILKPLIAECKGQWVLPEYQSEVSDEHILGIIVSKWSGWDGNKIIMAFLSALEDANYHTEVAQLEKLFGVKL